MDLQKIINDFKLEFHSEDKILNVNGHIHTPYSFSAFENIKQAVDLAVKENIKILGINDFFVADGYEEFDKTCKDMGVYPLFNIEFIGLIQEFQDKGIRVNDPGNPGRIYFSGKGLNNPFKLDDHLMQKLSNVQKESLEQVKQMVKKADNYFKENEVDIKLDYEELKSKYAVNLVRERHIAKAIRVVVDEKTNTAEEKKVLIEKVFGGKESKVDVSDNNALENEIRGNLLKAGCPAFVPEDPKAFMSLNEIIEIIINAGGIPCYPLLLDALKGDYTDFEGNWESMHKTLSELNVKCVELIPGRNSIGELEKFIHHFYNLGYIILLGTEHNTPELIPLKVMAGGNTPLTDEIKKISYESSCVVVAHQFLKSKGLEGYIDSNGKASFQERDDFIVLGKAVLKKWMNGLMN